MAESSRFERGAVAVAFVLFVTVVVVLVLGWLTTSHAGYERGQRDLKRELDIKATAGGIRSYYHEHHALPRALGIDSYYVEIQDVGPIGYRLEDAHRFRLGVRFEGARPASDDDGAGPAYAHPTGYVWYAFDATGFDTPREAGLLPYAVDPPPAAGR